MTRADIADRIREQMMADNDAYGELVEHEDGRIVVQLGIKPGTKLQFPPYEFPEGVTMEVAIVNDDDEWDRAFG